MIFIVTMDRKEAIEVLKKYKYAQEVQEALEYLHPELKESEDERIRNFLIGKFREIGEVWHEYSTKDIIAWLKKQGEHIKFLESIQIGDEVTRNPDGVLVNLSQLKRKAEQGEQNLANSAKTCKDEPKFKVGDKIK